MGTDSNHKEGFVKPIQKRMKLSTAIVASRNPPRPPRALGIRSTCTKLF
jgi:hypothetical protein